MYEQLAVLAVFVFLYSLVSARLERTVVSGPMIFVTVGFIMGARQCSAGSPERTRTPSCGCSPT